MEGLIEVVDAEVADRTGQIALHEFVPSYAEIAEAIPALGPYKYPPEVGVILRIAGRASQNGLAISIAQTV